MSNAIRIVLSVDTKISVLSSQCQYHKTERFIKETKRFSAIDIFISKVADSIILNYDKIKANKDYSADTDCYKIELQGGAFSLYFKLGYQIATDLKLAHKDIVFYKFIDDDNLIRRNDQRLITYLTEHKQFKITLTTEKDLSLKNEFKKLYNLSNCEHVNFPLMNAEQNSIVEIENQNALIQGVAGSGKTNICINKIVFTACREYYGRILYTTYSRGLLLDTENKVNTFIANLKTFVNEFEENKIVFSDNNHIGAIENKLGINLSVNEEQVLVKVKRIIAFLENQVDYLLLEDMYSKYIKNDTRVVDESYFIKDYVKIIKDHQLTSKLAKVKHLSYEVIFKEMYGMILGCYNIAEPKPMLTLAQYIEMRKDSFTRGECEVIYLLANDYNKHLIKNNLTDNNIISRILIDKTQEISKYSLAVIDEVQDMTEVQLYLLKSITRKLFCVGDALQMINPSYFSFSYLKRLLYEKDVVTVAELKNNYRNTRSIVDIMEKLGQINVGKFGTHSFVLKGECVDSDTQTSTVFIKDRDFIEQLSRQKYDNFTILVNSVKDKERLRKVLKKQEILTVSEIKGLERETVVLYNILSDNYDKWQTLERTLVNRKCADENSVFRYYFNLFYVGISRAKAHLYVAEDKEIPMFRDLFLYYFTNLSTNDAILSLNDIVSRIEEDEDELLERIREFINLNQYDNARFTANKIKDDMERRAELNKIDVSEMYIRHGKYREAGIRYWELSMYNEAKAQFTRTGDDVLIKLLEASMEQKSAGLNIDILQYFQDVENNNVAREMIVKVVINDLNQLLVKQKQLSGRYKSLLKEKNNGKQ